MQCRSYEWIQNNDDNDIFGESLKILDGIKFFSPSLICGCGGVGGGVKGACNAPPRHVKGGGAVYSPP